MFPSSGYFRGLDCPFYASGLCERPYCHYRHAKQSSEKDPSWIGKSTTINQKLNNHLGDTLHHDSDKGLLIEKAAHLNEVDKPFSKSTYSCTSNKDLTKLYTYKPQVGLSSGTYDKATNDSLDNAKYKPYTKSNCDGKSNYQPSCDNQIKKGRYEEYTISKKKEKKVSEYNCDIASNSVPEYNPTPISELKRMHRYSTQSTTHSDLEYDPVSNFDAGFSNKSFFNLLDNSYPSNQSVGDLNSGHSLYKPTKIPSDDDDEEHELVIDAKFSDDDDDDDDDDEEAVSSRLSDQGSDNETEDPTESAGHQLSFSKNKADDSGYSAHISNTSSSVSHKSSVDESKVSVHSSNKHVKTDSKSSSNDKLNKTSKSTNDVNKRHNHSVTTDGNKWKTSLDEKNKLEKNKSSPDNKIAKKKKISENEKISSSEKKSSSSDKRISSDKKTSTIEKKVSSHDKKISSEKKVSSSSSSEKKSSGCVSSSSSRDQSSIKKDKKEICSKEKSVAEKIKKIKESRSIHNDREVNGSSEKDRNVKEKEHRKSEHERNGSASKERIKDENRKIEAAASSLIKKSSADPGIKKKSNSQTKTDSNKVKLDPERKKELERRKSEGERKMESNLKKLESVRRKSESEIKRIELEKKKDGMSCKNSLYLKRKESDKKSKDNSGIEKVRQETSMAKTEKLQRLKELNERVGVWKANRTDHRTNSEGEKIPAKIRKTESSKVGDFTKKKLTHSSSDSKKISSNSSNNAIEKSKKRRLSSGENCHESAAKVIKRENSDEYGCSSSDENPTSKKHSDLLKNSKHKISNNSHSKQQQHSGVIKDKKNRSISIDDLFGEESSEDEGEESSSGAFGQSGGDDESTGLSDDDELNVIFGDTDLSENDPYEECLRIFNESNTQIQQQQQRAAQEAELAQKCEKKEIVVEEPDLQEGKKRVAHPGAASRQTDRFRKFVRPALARPTPAEVMQNRFLEKQKRLAAENKLQKEKSVITNLPARPSKINLLKHKMNITTIRTPESYHFNNERTIAGTATKNEKRTAHIPRKEVIKRPTIVADYRSKISATIRQRYLNLIVDEYMKFTPAEKVPEIALQGEIEVYKSCSSKLGYLNKAIHFIKKLRGLTNENNKESANSTEKQPAPIMKLPSALPEEKKLENNVTGRELYERLKPYILTEKELEDNHFPRPDGSGRAKFYLSDLNKEPYLPSDERFCVRCQKCYRVNSQGKSIVEDDCSYHWAKHYPRKVGNSYENRHRCCLGERGSSGCIVDTNHVHHKNKFDGSTGYMSTPKRPIPSKGPGVFAMDCEMVYTTAGMELAQITVVNSQGRVIYTTHVKPDHEVIDYNTRFSGVQEKDLKDCPVSLIQVQAVLMHNFSADTILIGHSLESDLMAVKLVHSTVIDTSVLYPHRVGKPFKRALKSLAHDYLNITIQENPDGHDSKEDAITALRLVHYRLNEDGNNSKKDHN